MELKVLSHASLLVRSRGKTLVTDPWLLGSCYWRSWWNYPPVAPEVIDELTPDAVYITHVHWDHFHGPTLKRFARDTLILVPLERSTRVRRDLEDMGFTNVVEMPHGKPYPLDEDFLLTSYQFSPWGDSALVVESEGVRLLNANDAKFMGGPLRQILARHGRFDFAFRSHSSANDRVCFRYTDSGESYKEDPMMYAASFYRFMEKVAPRYAVPFASNHCHLHRDVFDFNGKVSTPVQVREYVKSVGGFTNTELKIMVSGDGWDSGRGFAIADGDWFDARQEHIERYRDANTDKLEASYRLEERVRVRPDEFERFFQGFLAAVPRALKRSFRGHPIIFAAKYGEKTDYFRLDVWSGEAGPVEEQDLPEHPVVFEATALVLKKAMAANMFSHVGISKRVVYRSRKEDAKHMKKLNELLAAYEYEVLPLRRLLSLRTMRVYARRWRELVLYVRLFLGLKAGKTAHELEAEQLA